MWHVTRTDQSGSAFKTAQLWTENLKKILKSYHWKRHMFEGMLLLDHPLLACNIYPCCFQAIRRST